MRAYILFCVTITLLVLGFFTFLVLGLASHFQATRLQSTDAVPDQRQPQVGELWALAKRDPSPWEDPTILYEVCEVQGDWIRYVSRTSYGTCADAQAHDWPGWTARRAAFVRGAWRLDQRITTTAPPPPPPGD